MPVPGPGESTQGLIFDPALQHYPRGFRRGDPVLPPEDALRWQRARRTVMGHVIRAIQDTPLAGQLVARGSLTLKAIMGDEAREPGDVDWVVIPDSIHLESREGAALLNDVIQAVTSATPPEGIVMEHGEIARTDIWTYERASGHRIVFPWVTPGLPPGLVQMDFVFRETLLTPTWRLGFVLEEGQAPVSFMAASEEESLAWKLLWLHTDMHPQGKDLYDAVLLAERAAVPPWLLFKVLENAREWHPAHINARFPFARDYESPLVDWENFLLECPWVQGSVKEWTGRLWKALGTLWEDTLKHAAAGQK